MKLLFILLLCLTASSAAAQERVFRGEFVETYMAQPGFLETIPSDTRLNCAERLCSTLKSVRIYVFKSGEKTERFWSTDYLAVMHDDAEALLAYGRSGHIAYYDETNQLLYRDHVHRAAAEGGELQSRLQPETPWFVSVR